MIDEKETLKGNINVSSSINGVIKSGVKYVEPLTQEKNVVPKIEEQIIVPDEGYGGLSKVTVEPIPSEYKKPSGTLEIVKNDSYDVTEYENVKVDVPQEDPILQERIITPTEAVQVIRPGEGYEGLSQVTVNNIPTTYVKPNGTLPITTNGTHDVTNYKYVEVDVHDGEPLVLPYAPRFIRFQNYGGSELNDELSKLDTSNMTSFDSMFYYCDSLKAIDIKHFNTSKVIRTSSMFTNCTSLTSIDLSGWNVSNLANMSSMFSYCIAVKEINLSNWNPTKVVTTSNTFGNCKALTKLDIRSWVFSSSLSTHNNMFVNVPKNCQIIVKDDKARNWVKARRSDFTNVVTVAELGE